MTDGQSQLEEFEKYACSNIPGYKKFVPPPPAEEDEYIPTDPNELPIDIEVITTETHQGK